MAERPAISGTAAPSAPPAGSGRRLARFLSYALHPLALGTPVSLWVGIAAFGGLSARVAELIVWVGTLGLVFPMASLALLARAGKISDFFLTRHADRRWLYPIGLVDLSIILLLFRLYRAPPAIWATVAAGIASAACMAVANRWIKASLHVGGNAGILLALCWVEGFILWPVLALVPATIWSRVALREHTPREAATGLVLGLLPTALVLFYLLGAPGLAGPPGAAP